MPTDEPNTDSVYPRVAKIVAEVLVIDETEITPEKRLIEELGAESIDFLDLIFQLEREFKIKIPRGQIEKEARGTLPNEEFEQNGVLTEAGLAALKNYLSEVPSEYFKDKLKVAEIPTLFTIQTFCKLVTSAQNKQATAQ